MVRGQAAACNAGDTMKHLLLIYHSQTGHTAQLAQAVAAGVVTAGGCELRTLTAASAGLADLLWADGLLIGTPENFGTLSGMVKDFFDRTYYPAEGKTIGKPWALFVSAGNDGSGAVRQAERIASGYQWQRIAPALIVQGPPDAAALLRCNELGQTMAVGLELGLF